jgi:hypothetical protein
MRPLVVFDNTSMLSAHGCTPADELSSAGANCVGASYMGLGIVEEI